VLPQTGTTPATLSIGASALAPGNYSATVTLTPNSGAPLAIPVALKALLPAPVLTSVDPSFVPLGSDDTMVTFHGSGFTPQTQLLLLTAAWGYPVVYVDAQTLQTTMPYLSFLSEGSYPFSAVNPQSDVSGAVTVSIGRLTPVVTSVVNAASLSSGPLAAGELVQISGSDFGPASQFSVVIGGALAKVVSSSDTEALVIVPPQGPGLASTTVIVASGALPSLPMILQLTEAVLGVFTADGSGAGGALFTGTPSPGSTITLFGTGIADLTLPLKVKIGGEDAAVASVGPVDGQPGWFQVSVTIPDDAGTDAPMSVVLCLEGVRSQDGVTLVLTLPQ